MDYSFGVKTKVFFDFSNHILFSLIQFKQTLNETSEESKFNSGFRSNS